MRSSKVLLILILFDVCFQFLQYFYSYLYSYDNLLEQKISNYHFKLFEFFNPSSLHVDHTFLTYLYLSFFSFAKN